MGEKHFAPGSPNPPGDTMRDMAIKLEEKNFFIKLRQAAWEKSEKAKKIISRKKNNKEECKDWEKK